MSRSAYSIICELMNKETDRLNNLAYQQELHNEIDKHPHMLGPGIEALYKTRQKLIGLNDCINRLAAELVGAQYGPYALMEITDEKEQAAIQAIVEAHELEREEERSTKRKVHE